ncbi:MAG: cysteine--tRNA ligase [Nitrospinae bacterium]|nr:cysteine--tRNA ligase [Nitrospinota bacterium]
MTLRIYNTLSGHKEEFKPLTPGEVRMYVCGVTVYDRCHIGHARAGVVFDFVYRALKRLGFKVTYVRNFTDVDDKIIKRAAERGISCDELVRENIAAFYEDMDSLFLLRPDHEPRATGYIAQMQEMIKTLLAKGAAYESGGDVFFSVEDFSDYGKLSKRNVDELVSGARVAVNEDKKNPLDFALWKSAKPGEPKWPSPWGEGRPGWHIECSAMGKELLGAQFDVHGGGKDLVFPHHENEIAQSQGASGLPPARYWMHNGFVNINKEKMSKSLGNFFTIRDVTKKFDPEAVRLYLLSTHYRSPIDFADEYLREAQGTLDYLYRAVHRSEKLLGAGAHAPSEIPLEDVNARLVSAIEDDFNSAEVMALFIEAAKTTNMACKDVEGKKGEGGGLAELAKHYAALRVIGSVLGLLNRPSGEYFKTTKARHLADVGLSETQVADLIHSRNEARKTKNFAVADTIRKTLLDRQIEIEDTRDGTEWWVRR